MSAQFSSAADEVIYVTDEILVLLVSAEHQACCGLTTQWWSLGYSRPCELDALRRGFGVCCVQPVVGFVRLGFV